MILTWNRPRITYFGAESRGGRVIVRPGANMITDEVYGKLKDHPAFKAAVKSGHLKVSDPEDMPKAKASEVATGTQAATVEKLDDNEVVSSRYSVKKLQDDIIPNMLDVVALQKIMAEDTRKSVQALAKARIEEIIEKKIDGPSGDSEAAGEGE